METSGFLFLVYREKTGCRQYAFESLEEVEKWAKRKPYAQEVLTVHIGIERKPVATLYCGGASLGDALRAWCSEYPAFVGATVH